MNEVIKTDEKHHVKQLNGYVQTQFTKEFTMNTIKYK